MQMLSKGVTQCSDNITEKLALTYNVLELSHLELDLALSLIEALAKDKEN